MGLAAQGSVRPWFLEVLRQRLATHCWGWGKKDYLGERSGPGSFESPLHSKIQTLNIGFRWT